MTPTNTATATPTSTPTPQQRTYMANAGDDTVSVIDAATNAVVVTVPVGDGPIDVAVRP